MNGKGNRGHQLRPIHQHKIYTGLCMHTAADTRARRSQNLQHPDTVVFRTWDNPDPLPHLTVVRVRQYSIVSMPETLVNQTNREQICVQAINFASRWFSLSLTFTPKLVLLVP
ncbi:hypothetical protein LshimejAT787_1401390 [Lyophyllum shimeji]|uniref:Uncharacterized protein n=1 Tax=Lyophyllum shimeji TaxID=47721 RepID=A0A9P3PVE0_LYOSH|nr:hypothetical protein LshimejAT787_1401390 [Lyophyllum shimeji]